jgi:hypothetical protein
VEPSASGPADLTIRTIELPALAVRADVEPKSLNDEARTVELIFTTGAAVLRRDWWTGQAYYEKLSLDPDHVRLKRLNAGAPLLDTHSGWSLASQLGVVEDGTAVVNGKRGVATVRFSKRDEVQPIWQDVKDRIIRNVSVGYAVYEYDETPGKKGDYPTRTAVDWEPFEVSLVPMPADAGAQTRAGKPADSKDLKTYPCRITIRAAQSDQERTMNPEESETIAEASPIQLEPETRAADTTVAERGDLQLGAEAERSRVQGIMAACRAARMTTEFQDKLIRDGVSLVDAQTRVFDEMRKRGGESAGPQRSATATDVQLGPDPIVHERAGIEEALTHRLAGSLLNSRTGQPYFPLTDKGRKYRGLSMLDTARIFLQGRGIRVTDMSKSELAGVALGLVSARSALGLHTTSDFANLLADVANKTLRAAYDEAPQTFRPIVTVKTLSDFKQVSRVQLGDAPAFLAIDEHGEFKAGTISDGKETYQLTTYGRKFGITRKALVNDDTDAFSRVPMMFGRKARVLESNLVWAQITSNPTMGDGNALFSAAHGNLATDGDHISVESLGRARASLRQQTSLDGDYLNLSAAYLLVPTGIETKADQFVTVVTPQEAGKVNPFQNKLQVIAEPRLDANSATAWYLAASTGAIDIIELAYLEGEEGPMVESRVGFDIDGLEIRSRLDVTAKVIDWRGLYKDPGDLDS